MNSERLKGLIAATYTPLDERGDLNVELIHPMVKHLLDQPISGLYVCGSTGEGMSLSNAERIAVTRAYVEAANKQVPVIAQVGHNSVKEARELAKAACQAGVEVISATCPSYFKVSDVTTLIDCMAEVASGAPDLPFYYYHIPALTGSTIDIAEFLRKGAKRIPNLAGLKYTDTKLYEFQACLELEGRRFDVVWGCDEMLLGAIATGAQGAIGSTYNIAAPLYQQMITEFSQGNLEEARRLQSLSIRMIQTLGRYQFHPAMKATIRMIGFEFGDCRLPQGTLSNEETIALQSELQAIGFFQWSQTSSQGQTP